MSHAPRKIILAAPRGFCAGVHRAVECVETALKILGEPLYVHHEIVHNKYIVENFKSRGVKFIDALSEVPPGNHVIFSAHGVSPAIRQEAQRLGLKAIDATCPLVTKVHIEAIRYARKGLQIVFIGHKGHAEAEGVYGEAPEKITIVSNEKEIEELAIDPAQKYACLTQTTLSRQETMLLIEQLKKKIPDLQVAATSNICYATTNRQEAISQIAKEVDLFFVIGSTTSSNSKRLKELAEKIGKTAYLIDGASMINPEWLKDEINSVGITAGASVPELLVKEVIARLQSEFGFGLIEERTFTEEKTSFSPPEELQKLLTNH